MRLEQLKANALAAETRVVQITDVSPELFAILAQWMYTDEIALPPTAKSAYEVQILSMQLLKEAVKYDMPALRHACEVGLQRCINMKSCADILRFAHEAQAPQLQVLAAEYIAPVMEEVVATKGWLRCSDEVTNLPSPLLFS